MYRSEASDAWRIEERYLFVGAWRMDYIFLLSSFFFGLDQRFGIDATWFCKGRGDIQLIAGMRQVNG